jgi:hypothetical protein
MTVITNHRGSALLSLYFVITVILFIALALTSRSIHESGFSEIHKRSAQASAIAEAGFERALSDLRLDYINDPTPSYADGDINGLTCGPDTSGFYVIPYISTSIGTGSYRVMLRNVPGKTNEVWVRSTGTIPGSSRTIEGYVKLVDVSPWNNVIFAGTGASGRSINGNVDIRGSVHILGNGLAATDLAMDLSGSGNIGNNYEGIPAVFTARIPACPTRELNGETVQTLDAVVRVKRGQVGLSGTGVLGRADSTGNGYKETLDKVFINDGYTGNQGTANVHSDNGYAHGYDLGDALAMPSLLDPYGGYATYQDYLRANALVVTDAGQLSTLANIKPTSVFDYSSPKGRIAMDGNGNMVIEGIVYIDGGQFNMAPAGAKKLITYQGKGSVLATGDVTIDVDLLTAGPSSYPQNVIGVMTPGNINFSAASLEVMGLFYAETSVTAAKQTDIAGALMSNYFDMGLQVPSIFYVPEIINNLPPGMIGNYHIWYLVVEGWRRL